MPNKMRPIHPGKILKDELAELGMSANAFAREIGGPANRISAILKEERAVTADTALRFAASFKTTPEFWLHLQASYDLKVAKQNQERSADYRKKHGGGFVGSDGRLGPQR